MSNAKAVSLMQDRQIKKLCNALIPDATPAPLVSGASLRAVDRFSKKHGGLWVGDTVVANSASVVPARGECGGSGVSRAGAVTLAIEATRERPLRAPFAAPAAERQAARSKAEAG